MFIGVPSGQGKRRGAVGAVLAIFVATGAMASTPEVRAPFKKAMVVIFENEDLDVVISQPTFGKLAKEGALLKNFIAEVHPSQGNYIALVAGNDFGIHSDSNINLDKSHIGDLLEAAGKSWKIYLEAWPGNCFTGSRSGTYVRKHNPFISFKNIQNDRARCNAHLVHSDQLAIDIKNGTVPDFSIYVPDLNNDGHDPGVEYADKWLASTFLPIVRDPRFMRDMLLTLTFDEGETIGPNRVYTVLLGDGVMPGATSADKLSHFSLLRLFETQFGLGNLGLNDVSAMEIKGIWKP